MDTSNANRIGHATEKMKDGAAEMGAAISERGSSFASAALEKGAELKKAVVDKGAEALKHSEKYIKENPHSSVLYAFGLGALVATVAVLVITRNRE